MDSVKLPQREEAVIGRFRLRIIRLGAFFSDNPPPKVDTASDRFILARSFLVENLDMEPSMRQPRPREELFP